jgi:hypothetical protein
MRQIISLVRLAVLAVAGALPLSGMFPVVPYIGACRNHLIERCLAQRKWLAREQS